VTHYVTTLEDVSGVSGHTPIRPGCYVTPEAEISPESTHRVNREAPGGEVFADRLLLCFKGVDLVLEADSVSPARTI
jgi:hypothetical protein